ncbi:MAG: glycosyltransferase [Verrucomicrobiales bacterium]|nr:glycosyltransferase [Verrucomicrobiales bacterium]
MPPVPSTTHLVLIPTYNTGDLVLRTVREALEQWAPVWVVVDGSTDGSAEKLEAMAATEPHLRVLRLAKNQGKGAAVFYGARQAAAEAFTHILAMDADGQHPAAMIPDYMAASRRDPERMILGRPVFPPNAPPARVHGRKLANFWVNVFTLWEGVGDCLFGMRVYPVEPFVRAMRRTTWGRGYDFDPEAAMRLCWEGVRTRNLDTPVRYLTKDEGGVSHFRYLRDNVLLTWMYHRLFPGYLWKLPGLIAQKRRHRRADALADPDSPLSAARARERIALRFELPWHKHYVRSKLRTDPLYGGVAGELRCARPDVPLLDVGCGMGLLAFYLRETGWKGQIMGFDYDPRKIKIARQIAEVHYPGLDFRNGDARIGLPESRGHVTLLDILQFFSPTQQEEMLRQAARAVAPGGLLLIRNCLADDSWRFKLTRIGDAIAYLTRWMRADAVSYPTQRRIRATLEMEGLEGEFRPLWGRTPFNNWLAVYRRPESAPSEDASGTAQASPAA